MQNFYQTKLWALPDNAAISAMFRGQNDSKWAGSNCTGSLPREAEPNGDIRVTIVICTIAVLHIVHLWIVVLDKSYSKLFWFLRFTTSWIQILIFQTQKLENSLDKSKEFLT